MTFDVQQHLLPIVVFLFAVAIGVELTVGHIQNIAG